MEKLSLLVRNLVRFVVLALLLAFAWFNRGDVTISYFTGREVSMPLLVFVVLSLAGGALLVWVGAAWQKVQLRRENRKLRREIGDLHRDIERLKAENDQLRNLDETGELPIDIPRQKDDHAAKTAGKVESQDS